MKDNQKRPSEVFAVRLKETRKAREMTQGDLALKLREGGLPMSKAAVLRIERGERGLSLDEALAFAVALNAVPAYLLSPPEGERVWLTDNIGMDGEGIRSWLRYGLWNWQPAPDEGHKEGARADFQRNLAQLALALVDAHRGNDYAGIREVDEAIRSEVKRREQELEEATDAS